MAGLTACLLILPALPYQYGTAVDLIAGRRLYYRQLPGMTYYAEVRQSILSNHYRKLIGPLPAETRWVIVSKTTQYPPWLGGCFPEQPPPFPSDFADVVYELNQLVQYHPATDQVEGRLTDAARAALIEYALRFLRQREDPALAFNYLHWLRRQLADTTGWIHPGDLPTVEDYLGTLGQAK